jgi:hypothetical protein
MLRNTFAIVSGLFATMIVITFVELANARLFFPAPSGMDWTNKQAVAAFAASLPRAALVVVLAGWLLGAMAGAAVAAALADRHRRICAALIGVAVVAGVIQNAMAFPHPTWITAAGVLLPLPLAWLAEKLVPPRYRRGDDAPVWRGGDK